MNDLLLRLHIHLQSILIRDEGQDLVEYALVVALIAFGAVTGMGKLSAQINTSFGKISSLLASSL
jgi:pilus assembly protein Flp/PilA